MSNRKRSTRLLFVFIDLSQYWALSQRVDDSELADTMDAFYRTVWTAVDAAGGTTVKFIGDAALIVFPEALADRGVTTVFDLRAIVDGEMAERGWECRINARAHVGSAIAGLFGAEADQRFDVIGRDVSVTAKARGNGITLSPEAYAAISPETRARVALDAGTGAYVAP